MANTYKNIVITPNRDSDAANVPFIRFSGGDATTNTDINVRVYTTQSGTLSFEGSAGQLFSITNDLTNTIFSVNDVSGIPSLEIDAAGLIRLAEFGGNVAVGRSNASHKLDIVGTANASNILVNGNMVFTHANDGAGSNFDADLLDGQHGSYYGIATDVSAANRVANAAFLHANAAFVAANAEYAFSNSAHTIANLAFVHANAAYTQANAAIASASAGQATANAAFARANNSLLSSSYTAADVLAKLITVDGAGTTLDADLLDGQQGTYYGIASDVVAAFLRANNSLLSSSYTAADVLAKLITVDGAGTTLDADLLDGQQGTYYGIATDVVAAFLRANNSLLSSSYTAADVLAKLITVDGAGTSLDADLLDGQQGTYYGIASDVVAAFLRANNSLLSSSYTAADVLSKLITVDGAGTNLDADLLDGQQGSYYGIATDVSAANRVANAAFLHANAGYAFANSSHSIANLAFTHANNAYATANGRVSSVSGTGTVSGITLSGTVTTTGSITLGGTLSASIIDNMSDEHRLFNNMGDNHNSRTAFDITGPSINFGWRFVQGSTNGPGVTGTQFYTEYLGLGNEYPATGAGSYGMQIAYPRNVTEPYITIRYNEANTFTAWQKVSAGNSDKLGGQAGSYYGIASDVTAAFLRANNSLLSSSYTAADVLAKLITVDGAGTTLDADLLDGQHGSYYGIASDVTAAFLRANNSLLSSSYTAADVLAKLITVDGAGTSLDADLLDGQHGSYYGIATDVTAAFLRANNSLLSSSYTAADVLSKLLTVDGAGSNIDTDLLDGQHGSYYGIATDVTAANRVANAAFLHANAAFAAANADYNFSNSAHSIANLAFVHANAAFAKANSGSAIVITPDALNATRYITFEDSTTGNMANANVSTSLTYNPGTNRLAVGGTGTPSNTLHVFGTANVSGTLKSAGLYDSTNRLLLIKNSAGTVVWGN
jgi:hypothetical protein